MVSDAHHTHMTPPTATQSPINRDAGFYNRGPHKQGTLSYLINLYYVHLRSALIYVYVISFLVSVLSSFGSQLHFQNSKTTRRLLFTSISFARSSCVNQNSSFAVAGCSRCFMFSFFLQHQDIPDSLTID